MRRRILIIYRAVVGRDDEFNYLVRLSSGGSLELSFMFSRAGKASVLSVDGIPIERWGGNHTSPRRIDYCFARGTDRIEFQLRVGSIVAIPRLAIAVNSEPIEGSGRLRTASQDRRFEFFSAGLTMIVVGAVLSLAPFTQQIEWLPKLGFALMKIGGVVACVAAFRFR